MTRDVPYTRALRRGWPLIVIALAVALVTAFVLTQQQPRRYRSSSMLVVTPAAGVTARELIDSIESLERRTVVATFARLATTDVLRDAVASQLGITPDRARLFRVDAAVVPNTNMIRIDVEGPDAAMTASFANGTALATAREAQSLYRVYAMRLVNRAVAASRPSHPDPKRNLLVAALAGLALGVAAALALDRLRNPPPQEEP